MGGPLPTPIYVPCPPTGITCAKHMSGPHGIFPKFFVSETIDLYEKNGYSIFRRKEVYD
jgi:hypothetical protein